MESKLPGAACESCTLNQEPLVPPFGDGRGYIALVGEAPGVEEVKHKPPQPFVGKAGKLLRQTMVKLDIDVEKCYFSNSVMCRPPDNRDPKTDEIKCCRGRLALEIKKVKPEVIIPLGAFGHQAVTGRVEKIKKARGKPEFVTIAGHRCVAISSIHPAALLRIGDDFPDLCFDLHTALNIFNGDTFVVDPPTERYYLIEAHETKKMERLLERLESLTDKDTLSVDLETDGLRFVGKDIITCGLSWKRDTAVAFEWNMLDNPEFKKRFADVLSSVPCSFHNAFFDIPWLWDEYIDPRLEWDTMLNSYALDERKGVHDLERLSISYYKAPPYKLGEEIKNVPEIDRRELLEYNATDADYTRRLTDDLRAEMDDKESSVMNNLLMPAVSHFVKQFESGMLVDQNKLRSNGEKWGDEIEEVVAKLREFRGAENINPNSPRQVSKYLYGERSDGCLGLKRMGGGKLDTIDKATLYDEIREIEDPEAQEYWHTQSVHTFEGMSSKTTNTYMLFWLAQQEDQPHNEEGQNFPRLMVRHRLLSKKYGTYYKGLENATWPDGRIRPSWRLHGTVTGRQSSSDPNLHGTPRDDTIKSVYISDPGFAILYGDYPQAEVRMLGHFSNDENLIRVICSEDIHAEIAKVLFRLSDGQWKRLSKEDKELRRRAAKTIVFGIIYGRGAKGLAPQLGQSAEECQLLINRLLDMMPMAKLWIQKKKMDVLIDREVESLYERKRRFNLIFDKRQRSEVQRQAVNMPIQSSVSDMTFRSYYQTCQEYEKIGIEYKRWAQIHDAFMIQVKENSIRQAGIIMKDIMENHLDFETDVPFGPVEIKVGRSWGELVDVDEYLAV